VGFAAALSQSVEDAYSWTVERGVAISRVAIVGIEYDEATRELLKVVQRADALSGSRGNSNMQASVAAGFQSAGSVEGSAGILGLGLAVNNVGAGGLQQPTTEVTPPVTAPMNPPSSGVDETLVTRLQQLKNAFDSGLITQVEYDASRAKALGL
jgi:membrane protease subunit (stomatin/prohibitin family)